MNFDKDIVATKIESILRALERIRTHTPESSEKLSSDYDSQDIISINLERVIQSCVDISAHIISNTQMPPPQTMAESFTVLEMEGIISAFISSRMKKAVGFRNISVHDYQSIDWAIVYSICTKQLADFEEFVRQLINYCKL